jgi:hypothetical protein
MAKAGVRPARRDCTNSMHGPGALACTVPGPAPQKQEKGQPWRLDAP